MITVGFKENNQLSLFLLQEMSISLYIFLLDYLTKVYPHPLSKLDFSENVNHVEMLHS